MVERYDLIHGLQQFKIRRRIRPTEKAILGFDGRFFSIEALERVMVSNATGVWPGLAYISAASIVALARIPPIGDPVKVICNGGRVQIGTLSTGCTWTPVSRTLARLPAAPDWIQALSLKYRATRAEIINEDMQVEIQEAERKLALLIAQIAKRMAPLGVTETETDLRKLAEARLAERFGNKGSS